MCVFFLGGGRLQQNIFSYLSSYFAPISLHANFHNPRTISSRRKVCVGAGGGWFEGKFSVSFVPNPE